MLDNTFPVVSVIIPTYNRVNTIQRAINSVLKQTYKNFELIIVDDGSTDNTENVILRENDDRIVFLKHDTNKGGSAARNTGISHAKGKYIAFLDSDDEWCPEKLKKQVEALDKLQTDDWGGIYCGYYYIKKNGEIKKVEALQRGKLKKELLKKELDIGASSTLLFSRTAIEDIGLFDESFERHQDWEFLVRFFGKYGLWSIEQPCVKIFGHNPPKAEKAVKAREKYLLKYEKEIQDLGISEPQQIYAIHWFEIAKLYASEGNLVGMSKYLKKSFKFCILPLKNYLILVLMYLRGISQ